MSVAVSTVHGAASRPAVASPSAMRRHPANCASVTVSRCRTASGSVRSTRWIARSTGVLGAIRAPVRVLLGSNTKPFFTASAQYVADHVPNAHVHEIPGVAHAAPLTHPAALADALIEFFAPAPQPA